MYRNVLSYYLPYHINYLYSFIHYYYHVSYLVNYFSMIYNLSQYQGKNSYHLIHLLSIFISSLTLIFLLDLLNLSKKLPINFYNLNL